MKNNCVFSEIPIEKITKNNLNHFCHYGWIEDDKNNYDWEGYCKLSFGSFAQSYYESAEILFEKFQESKDDFRILNYTGITMCFIYRHFVELSIKYLYLRLSHPNKDTFMDFLKHGHNLQKLWNELKPVIIEKGKIYHCSANLKIVEKYITDIHKFDKKSEKLRYPIDRNLRPTNYDTKLDIFNLHNKMQELHKAFEDYEDSFPPCEMPDIPSEELTSFLKKYHELKPKIESFLSSLKSDYNTKSKEKDSRNLYEQIMDHIKNPQPTPFDSLSDDELILLDALYYTGDNINFQLYKDPHRARVDAVKRCVLNMKRDKLEFGKPANEKIGVTNKRPDLILQFVLRTMSAIDRK